LPVQLAPRSSGFALVTSFAAGLLSGLAPALVWSENWICTKMDISPLRLGGRDNGF
jgi:hypothetical protein